MESGKWKTENIEDDLRLISEGKPKNRRPFSVFRFPFSILSNFYAAILNRRISLYETGALQSYSLGAPTVSVGNLTVGGTGKTPLVAYIAEILADEGEKVCIISRGYKRENAKRRVLVADGENILANARQAGDEPLELARKLAGKAVVVSDANRVAAARWTRERFEVTAFVLDDAFQHLRARRDADIVVVDATNPFGNRKLVPLGILREPLENLKRAGAVVITRANLVESVEDLTTEIRRFNLSCPIFVAENKISRLTGLKDFHANRNMRNPETERRNLKFFAFCGLGNPQNFYEQLARENFALYGCETFPDHYVYRQNDCEKIEKKALEARADALITTAKDAVKLANARFALPCFVAAAEMIFREPDEFSRWLKKAITGRPKPTPTTDN